MVKLTGTEKQIEWAEKIRNSALNGFSIRKSIYAAKDRVVEYLENNKKYLAKYIEEKKQQKVDRINRYIAEYTEELNQINDLIAKCENETSAKWFIDNRAKLAEIQDIA